MGIINSYKYYEESPHVSDVDTVMSYIVDMSGQCSGLQSLKTAEITAL